MGCGATKTKVTKVAPQEPEGLTAVVTDASDTSSAGRGKARLCSVTGRSETAEIECPLAAGNGATDNPPEMEPMDRWLLAVGGSLQSAS